MATIRNLVLIAAVSALGACSQANLAAVGKQCHVASTVEAQNPTLVNPSGKIGSKITAGQTILCDLVSAETLTQTPAASVTTPATTAPPAAAPAPGPTP